MKQNLLKTFTSITVILFAVLFYNSYKLNKKIKLIKTNNHEHYIAELYQASHTSLRGQQRLFSVLDNGAINYPNYLNLAEEICKLKIEEGMDITQTASGYDDLSKIYAAKGGKANLFKAIDFASRAIELSLSTNRTKTIYKLLNLDETKHKQDFVGHFKLEEKLLIDIINAEAQNGKSESLTSFACSARLSNIYKFGRSSSLEQKSPPQFKKALEMRQMAFKQININIKNNVDIVLIIDNNYSQHAAATVSSILINAYPETYYNFHFLMDPENVITKENQDKLRSLTQIKDCSFEFKVLPDGVIPDKFMHQNKDGFMHWPRLIMLRLFLEKAYPEKQRILYLDADIIVRRDLRDLYQINLTNHLVAGASDIYGFRYKNNCKYKELHAYLNSGVLLFNLEQWRISDMNSKILKEMNCKKCKPIFYDQDIINRIAKDHIYEISARWNHPSRHPDPISFISHMITEVKNIKNVSVEKAWKQPEAEQLWLFNPEEIPEVFWDYWAALDITPWKVNHS